MQSNGQIRKEKIRTEQKRIEKKREKKRSRREGIKGEKIEKDMGEKSEATELSNIQIECSAKVGSNHRTPKKQYVTKNIEKNEIR